MGKEYTRSLSIIGNVPSLGSVIYFDDFETGFDWYTEGIGTEIAEKSNEAPYQGAYSMKLGTQASTPLEADWVKASRYIPVPSSKLMVIEFLIFSNTSKPFGDLELYFQSDDLSNIKKSAFFWDFDTKLWHYRNSAGSYTSIPGSSFKPTGKSWSRVRAVIDLYSNKYVSLQINNIVLDLSAHSFSVEASADASTALVWLRVYSSADGTEAITYIDNFLITDTP